MLDIWSWIAASERSGGIDGIFGSIEGGIGRALVRLGAAYADASVLGVRGGVGGWPDEDELGVVDPTDGVDGVGPPNSAADSIPGGNGAGLKAVGAGCGGGGGGVVAKSGALETAAANEVGGSGGAGAFGRAELLLRPSCFSAKGKPLFQHEFEGLSELRGWAIAIGDDMHNSR